ncbi:MULTISPECIES: hypothetical protein [Symbiopectobacterium]|uniref:hypothetical protein n=1 Tax=Symbiopectobacterium TaxID=801 RepID=UPI00207AE2CA|nr:MULTISPECIES: hypothetical protein [Symbiopectobacterium]MBT9429438.1 hypothetical protein [Candidatus Symbiopectobacterium endolongispinus]
MSGGDGVLNTGRFSNLGLWQSDKLHLTAQQAENRAQLLGVNKVDITLSGDFVNTGTGEVASGGALTFAANAVDNAGTVQGQQLLLTAQDVTNQGTLLGLTQLALHTQRLTNLQGGKIFSAQDLLLETAELNQQGQLLALGNLDATFTAPLLFTQQMAAGKRLLVTVNGDFDQRGTMRLLTDSLTNRLGTILAGKDLWIQRDAQGSANTSVLNRSSTIETQNGDITIVTGDLTNQREGFVVTESVTNTEGQNVAPTGTSISIRTDELRDYGFGYYIEDVYNSEPGSNDTPGPVYYRYWRPAVSSIYNKKEYLISEKITAIESPNVSDSISSASNIYKC